MGITIVENVMRNALPVMGILIPVDNVNTQILIYYQPPIVPANKAI